VGNELGLLLGDAPGITLEDALGSVLGMELGLPLGTALEEVLEAAVGPLTKESVHLERIEHHNVIAIIVVIIIYISFHKRSCSRIAFVGFH
jgi:hypothetical protein